MAFEVRPRICRFDTCREFVQAFALKKGDLLVTNEYIYEPYFAPLGLACDTVFLERYGQGEPTDVMVDQVAADVGAMDVNRVVAVGGGSVLDVAKLLALRACTPVLELVDGKIQPVRNKALVAVPTTCGTGSEVTQLAALALTTRGTKAGFGTAQMYADDAVLIPELLHTLPLAFFATSSIDAFVHAIESYLSVRATRDSRLFSQEAMRLILQGYLRMEREGNDARFAESENFLTAATYAGIAFGNAGCAAVHAMSYPLGGQYHVPHGESNYAMFRGVFAMYMHKAPDGEIAALNRWLAAILDCAPQQVYERICSLFNHVLPAKKLREYGMQPQECETFAQIVQTQQTRLTNNNYVPLTQDEYAQIYRSLY